MLTRQQIADWALSRGWKTDKFGNLLIVENERTYRIKFSAISIQYEKRIYLLVYPLSKWKWLRLSSGYYRNLSITPEGKLEGMKA